jgi:arogenate dehydrogenase (NADP+)
LLRSLVSYRHSLDQIIELIKQKDWQTLEEKLTETQLQRPQFFSAANS